MTGQESAAVEKALGEPVFVEFSNHTQKIRTKLFFVSSISIAICLYGLKLNSESSFLGLRFNGLEHAHVINTLLILVSYLLIHFIWCATDSFLEWRLRITGTRTAFITGAKFTGEHEDYPTDPKQSTLYNWTRDKRPLDQAKDAIELIETKLDDFSQFLAATPTARDARWGTNTDPIDKLRPDIQKLSSSIETMENTLESERVKTSLKRFDDWFKLFLRSQNLRWLAVEFMLPILLAGYAIALLATPHLLEITMLDLSSLDTFADLPTVIIALCALVLTFMQARSTKKHNMLSVKPHLTMWEESDYLNNEYQVDLINNGLGPAHIKSAVIMLDSVPLPGKQSEPLESAYRQVFPDYQFESEQSYLNPGFSIAANDRLVFGKVDFNGDNKPSPEVVKQALERIDIVIHYESAYGESITMDTKTLR